MEAEIAIYLEHQLLLGHLERPAVPECLGIQQVQLRLEFRLDLVLRPHRCHPYLRLDLADLADPYLLEYPLDAMRLLPSCQPVPQGQSCLKERCTLQIQLL